MPLVGRSPIEAREIHRGKGLEERLSLTLALSTIQLECIEFPCCRLPKWEAKTRHGVSFVPALLKTLEEAALSDLSLDIELDIPFAPNQDPEGAATAQRDTCLHCRRSEEKHHAQDGGRMPERQLALQAAIPRALRPEAQQCQCWVINLMDCTRDYYLNPNFTIATSDMKYFERTEIFLQSIRVGTKHIAAATFVSESSKLQRIFEDYLKVDGKVNCVTHLKTAEVIRVKITPICVLRRFEETSFVQSREMEERKEAALLVEWTEERN
ncbi:hypothetical protein TNCV_3654491 [Trichonephila clavipes]|nr:hypothetical protein TNCV_3654491 [Trichonephila clavipes]